MPNWVFNSISNYPEEVHEKYKGEDTDIDFDKIIPEPESIKNTPSGSYNGISKSVYRYNQYYENLSDDEKKHIQYDPKNPLKKELEDKASRTTTAMGELVIENPDKSLNVLLSDEDKHVLKDMYDEYVDLFGNKSYNNFRRECKDFGAVYSKYISKLEEKYSDTRSKMRIETGYANFPTLEDLGKTLIENQEKYGFDNWYDWRVANWGTKWNASESNYDEETGVINFDTAWSIPYPIISKIAEDNPEVELDGRSEEESGWYETYSTKDGKTYINSRGEYQYKDDDSDECIEVEDVLDPPEEYTHEQILKESIDFWNGVVNNKQ